MEILIGGYGYKAGSKMRFVKNRHESLSYKIAEGTVAKLSHIVDHGGGAGNIILYLYNPEWMSKKDDALLAFWPDEVEVM